MSVRMDKNGMWRYRKQIKLSSGKSVRIFGTPARNTKLAAEQAERGHIDRVLNPSATEEKEVPRFKNFAIEFMETYVRANNKPSEQLAKENIFKVWLRPRFNTRRIDDITVRDVELLKAEMLKKDRSAARINNVLTVLGKMLRYAAELDIIKAAPRIKLLRIPPQKFEFLDDDELPRLLDAARSDPELYAAILCGADAGLRSGEIKGLDWDALDLKVGVLTVRQSLHRGILTSPKSGRERSIPMTERLRSALKALRHLRGEAVFCKEDGSRYTRHELDWRLRRTFKRAQLRWKGWHSLRHTFCTHLAMRGAPARAIQELAGHSTLNITQRYMHLVPGAGRDAILLLEALPKWQYGGNGEEVNGQ